MTSREIIFSSYEVTSRLDELEEMLEKRSERSGPDSSKKRSASAAAAAVKGCSLDDLSNHEEFPSKRPRLESGNYLIYATTRAIPPLQQHFL
jgi:hypothetical protein